MIEAGALVLADQGVCCIDEFNIINKSELIVVHEAMEQQTISVAKAGICQKVNSRTSIIAACNPIQQGQKYNPELSLEKNTGLESPLLSRFDLIFILRDELCPETDSATCDFILNRFLPSDQLIELNNNELDDDKS